MVCQASTGGYHTELCSQVLGPAAQERHGPDIPKFCRRGWNSSLCTVTKGQGVSNVQLQPKKSESDTRKILVMIRTMKGLKGSPREDRESPSLEAFNNYVGQISAGKV